MVAEIDLLIRGGKIVDGTGAPAFKGNVGVRDGRIAYIGEDEPEANEVIDATGRFVTPGFIDTHTHYDAQLTWDPYAAPHSLHGVTTVICGNCGFTLAPIHPASKDYLVPMFGKVEGVPLESLEEALDANWSTTAEMLAHFDGKVGVNVGFMTGHSTLRAYVMGERAVAGTPTADEMKQMKALLRQSLGEGSLGFSSSHAETHTDHHADHVPSYYASHDELLELMSVVSEFEGTFAGYVGGVSGNPSPEDALRLAEVSLAAKRPYSWPAIFPGSQSREKQLEKLASVDVARKMGADVRLQVMSMPTSLHMNFLTGHTLDQLPGIWPSLFSLPPAERIERFKDPETRRTMERDALGAAEYFRSRLVWGNMKIANVDSPSNAPFFGRMTDEIAREQGKSDFDALLDIVIEDRLATLLMPMALIDESKKAWKELVEYVLDDRGIWGGDDGGAHVDMIDSYSHGTRFLENAVRKYGFISLEEAINAFTKRPAEFMGLRDRGVLTPGACADILVFDLETVGVGDTEFRSDLPAGGRRLYTPSRGFDYVIVNGKTIAAAGEYTGVTPGQVFRSGRDTYTKALLAEAAE
jgi:N-acyl-D-aspartate/D-glutamate deacylase